MPALSSAWGVLALFLIPWGGGIPGGVLLAKARGLPWPETATLYFISDLIQAAIFEPLMRAVARGARGNPRMDAARAQFRRYLETTASAYGRNGGPLTLFLVAFGVDPFTGRAASAVAGHGIFSGWTLAIAGDMLFFAVMMASTLWLKSMLGNGTVVSLIVLGAAFGLPALVQRLRKSKC